MKGFIYALKNRAYGGGLIKIGRTTRCPDQRAKELYSGSTGVPEKFDVALYCQVDDCEAAEARIHDVLSRYRQNKNREFFVASLQVARMVIDRVCKEINGLHADDPSGGCVAVEISAPGDTWGWGLEDAGSSFVPLSRLRPSATFRSEFTPEQLDRLRVVVEIMGEVFPGSFEKWASDFRRDRSIENELRIWEFISKAYLRATSRFVLDEGQKSEVFALLLMRSQQSSKRVIRAMTLKAVSPQIAEIILEGYEDKPRPLIVERAGG